MAFDVEVNVKLNDKGAKASVSEIERAYQHLKKEVEKPLQMKYKETDIQKQINALTGVSKKAKSAAQSYQSMAKIEVEAVQKITAAEQKLAVQQKRLENKAMVDQMKRQAKEAEEFAKSVAKIQAAYDKLSNAKAKAESKTRSSDSKEAFRGYLQRAKEEEEILKSQEKIQAAYDKLSSAKAKARAKEQSAGAKEAFSGYLQRAKEAEEFLKTQEKIQAAYDKESERRAREKSQGAKESFSGYLERAKEAEEFLRLQEKIQAAYDKESERRAREKSQGAKESFSGYLERAKEAEEFLRLQEKIQAAYDKESNTRRTAQEKDGKEAFKGYLERAAAAEKAAKAEEKLAQATEKMGTSLGKVSQSQLSSFPEMRKFIQSQEGMGNASVKATGIIRNSVGTFQTYRASVEAGGGATNNFRIAVDTATGEVYSLDKGISSVSAKAVQLSKSFVSGLKQLVGFTGVVQVLRSALREMKSMNDELVTYRKVTGASASDMEKMRSAAYKAAQNYGQSPSDFLAGAATMARAGYGAASGQMAELATKTQLVGDMTADAASKFLIAVDAAYHYQGSITQLTKVLDGINEVDNNYATSIEKISEGMTLVASLASSAHVPIEELTAALGTMTAVTQRSGTETARGLRQIFLNIMGDTTTEVEEGVKVTEEEMSAMTKALQKYAPEVVKAAKATGKLINPMEAIGALAKQYKEGFLTEQDLFKITEGIGGKRYYNVFTALIQNYDMYEGMLNKVKNSAGSADKEVAAMMDSWSKKLEKLKSTWTELVNNTISENFIKGLLDAGTGALKFAGNLENLAMMAGSAYAAIKLLSSGLKGVNAGTGFGSFNAWGLGITAVVAAIGTAKALGEKAFSDSVAAAQKAAQATQEQAEKVKRLGELIKQYKQLASDGVIDTTELETVKTLQSEIAGIIGTQASNVDLVNGKVKDQIKLLGQAYKEYAKQAYNTARGNTATAAAKVYDANSSWTDRITGAGLRFDKVIEKDKVPESVWEYVVNSDAFVKTLRKTAEGGWEAFKAEMGNSSTKGVLNQLLFGYDASNPSVESILKKYDAAQKLKELYASVYSPEELAQDSGFKDLVSGIEKMAEVVEAYRAALQAEYGALADSILAQDDFASKTFESEAALQQYIDQVAKANNLNDDQKKALEEVAKAYAAVEKAAKGAGGAAGGGSNNSVNKLKDDWESLQDSINAATEAKKNFDAEMQENKGSAAKSYAEAFKKYKEEVAAGRVNSTAFHASARMLLGDDEYFKTGGSSAKIRSRMARKGQSGSVKDASDILFQTYKSKSTGKEMEGYGIYQLLKQTKGLDKIISGGQKALTDKNGNMVIPKLTDQQLGQISKQWGGISVDMLKSMLNAFDQYDKNGKNTSKKYDEDKKARDAAKKKAKADQDAADAAKNAGKANQDAADATKNQTQQQQENSDKTKDATPNVDDLGSAAKDAAEALEETADKTGDGNGQGGGEPEKSAADKLNESLDKAQEKLKALSETTIDPQISAAALSFFANLQNIQEDPNIEVGLTGGDTNDSVVSAVDGIASQIQYLDGLAQDGKIPLEVAADIKGDLQKSLAEIIQNTTTIDGLDTIYETLKMHDYVTPALNRLLKKKYTAIVKAQANTKPAEDDIKAAAEKKYPDAEVKVVIPNQEDAIENVQAVSEGPYDNADVKVALDDKDAKAGIAELQKPGKKTIVVTYFDRGGGKYKVEGTTGNGTDFTGYGGNYATGTSYHSGGPALVNDGAGPELIVDKGRAFIAGGGKPSILNLSKGAKVFTASQTRDIFMRSGVPAFKEGIGDINTGRKDDYVVDSGKKDDKKKDTKKKTTNSRNNNKKSSKSSKSGEKDDSYSKLIDIIDYIMNRIGKALEEQFKVIDEQIANIDKQMAAVDDQIDALQKKREKQKQKDELAEKKKAVTDANKDLKEAKSERVMRYLGTDGKWHWMADKKAVAKAQESADSAKKDLKEYKDELAYQKEVEKLENKKKGLDKKKTKLEDKKTGLQNNYDDTAKLLDDIKEGVNTPTGSITALLNQIAKKGTKQEKAGAKALQEVLFPALKSGKFSKNFSEAKSAVKAATKGNPVMPGDSGVTLASLIAGGGGGNISGTLLSMLTTAVAGTKGTKTSAKNVTNNNGTTYILNGVKIDASAAKNKTVSQIMQNLKVYAAK